MLSLDSKIRQICSEEGGTAVLQRHLPKLVRSPSFQMTMEMRLGVVCRFKRWRMKPEQIQNLAEALKAFEKQ